MFDVLPAEAVAQRLEKLRRWGTLEADDVARYRSLVPNRAVSALRGHS